MDTFEPSDEELELLTFTLPNHHRPGTDLLSKLVLKDKRAMDIVITALLGENVCQSYTTGDCEWGNYTKSDVLYISTIKAPELSPILIEVQHTVDLAFMKRAAQYCLSVYNVYKQEPTLLVICINNISSDVLAKSKTSESFPFLREVSCEVWAIGCFLLDSVSISNFLGDSPLNPMVGLGHFFTQQRRTLLALRERRDPTLQLLYTIAKERHEAECAYDDSKADTMMKWCDQMELQLQKILKSIQDPASASRVMDYTNDGIEFVRLCRRKCSRRFDSRPVTPMGEPAGDIAVLNERITGESSRDNLPAEDIISDPDFQFAEEFKTGASRMSWKICYQQGQKKGLFRRFTDSNSLKASFNRKSRVTKRK